jgi:hypothetical protein
MADVDEGMPVIDNMSANSFMGYKDSKPLGVTSCRGMVEVGEDMPVIDTFTKVSANSSSWMVHSLTGLEFRLEKTFLNFNQGKVEIPERSASCGKRIRSI